MRSDKAVFEKGLVQSRSRAALLINENSVSVNGKIINKASFDVKDSDTLRFSKGDTIDVEVTAFGRTMPMLVCGFADSDTLKTSSDDIGKQLRMFVKPTTESEILRQGMQLVIP